MDWLNEVYANMHKLGIYIYPSADRRIMENALSNLYGITDSDFINEGKYEDNPQDEKIRQMILSNNNWEIDDYDSFISSLYKSKRMSYLTKHTAKEMEEEGYHTYKLKGYNIGFALHYDNSDGETDIVSVHNNEPNIHNIGDALLTAAKENGGTKLDHFDGFLSNFYERNGFQEYERWKWDDQYAPKDWDYENNGRPDVVLRKLYK